MIIHDYMRLLMIMLLVKNINGILKSVKVASISIQSCKVVALFLCHILFNLRLNNPTDFILIFLTITYFHGKLDLMQLLTLNFEHLISLIELRVMNW